MNARRALVALASVGGVVVATGCDPTKPPTFTIRVGQIVTIDDGAPVPGTFVRGLDRLDVRLSWSEDIYERCQGWGGRNRWNHDALIATCEGVDPDRYQIPG